MIAGAARTSSSVAAGEVEIVWRDPPPPASRQSLWAEWLARLRERPGQWALIQASTASRVGGLRGRLSRREALADFEFRTHRNSETTAELYARCVTAD